MKEQGWKAQKSNVRERHFESRSLTRNNDKWRGASEKWTCNVHHSTLEIHQSNVRIGRKSLSLPVSLFTLLHSESLEMPCLRRDWTSLHGKVDVRVYRVRRMETTNKKQDSWERCDKKQGTIMIEYLILCVSTSRGLNILETEKKIIILRPHLSCVSLPDTQEIHKIHLHHAHRDRKIHTGEKRKGFPLEF